MNPFFEKISREAARFLWGDLCLVCGAGGAGLCAGCRQGLRFAPEAVCPLCGAPEASAGTCRMCLADPPAYDGHRALLVFNDTAQKLVHDLKYGAGFWARRFYADGIARGLCRVPLCDAIVPVPLHPRKLRERGYNQSLLLASCWKTDGAALLRRTLVRVKDTPSQTGLDTEARQANLEGAFAVRRAQDVRGKKILLVDDVHTTGATLNAATRVLKEAGAAAVWAATLAIVEKRI